MVDFLKLIDADSSKENRDALAKKNWVLTPALKQKRSEERSSAKGKLQEDC